MLGVLLLEPGLQPLSSIIFKIGSCLDHDAPTHASLCSRDDKVHTSALSHWLRWGLMNFLPVLALSCDPSEDPLLQEWMKGPGMIS
jgi:hypothetical protein